MRTIVLVITLALGLGAAAAPLEVQFGERSLNVSQVTPGARVLIFAITRDVISTHPTFVGRIVVSALLTDDDGDGRVLYDLGKPVPHQGMWVVVDVASGKYVAAPTPGYEPVQLQLTPDVAKNDNAGQLKKIEWPLSEIDVVVVRPGSGAWHLYASRGSELDENKDATGPLRLDLEAMHPVGDSHGAPKNLKKGDLVAVFHPRRMRFGVFEVNP
jgi:hypothetical protein